jgi:predicted AAA+ superfamily ATPase
LNFNKLILKRFFLCFFKNPKECDFITEEQGTIISAVQVCYELTQENRDRELGGLMGAMQVHGLAEGTILTYLQEESIAQGGSTIRVLPAWKWLISES